MSFRSVGCVIASVLSALGMNMGCSGQGSRQYGGIRIAADTTILTEPLRPDGTVDYVAAVNARQSQGVTPENNAAILLSRAIGPSLFDESVRAKAFKRIGIEVPPDKGPYIVSWSAFMATHHSQASSSSDDLLVVLVEPVSEDVLNIVNIASNRLWTDKDYPLLAQCLTQNEERLALVVEASKRPRLYMPIETKVDDGRMFELAIPSLGNFRGAVQLLAARATNKVARGDIDGALDDLLACHRLGSMVSRCYTLIERFVGYGLDGSASIADAAILKSGKLSEKQAMRMLADLQAVAPVESPAQTLLEGERYVALDIIATLATEGRERTVTRMASDYPIFGPHPAARPLPPVNPDASTDWNRELIGVNAMFDRYRQAYEMPTRAERCKTLEALDEGIVKLQRRVGLKAGPLAYMTASERTVRKAYLGAIRKDPADGVMAIVGPSFWRSLGLYDLSRTHRQLAEVGLALMVYKARTGSYPAELSQLVGGLLKAAAVDAFSDKPLVYKLSGKGYVLYSVGFNMKDDGGVEAEDMNDGDIVLKVE